MKWSIVVVLALTAGCSSETNRDIAAAAVDKFHSQLNDELYQLIYLQADKEFKGNEAAQTAYLKLVRDTMGKTKEATPGTSSVHNFQDEAQITLAYVTDFEQGRGLETFVFRVKDKQAKLMHYECGGPGLSRD
jgi:hypothetical protein